MTSDCSTAVLCDETRCSREGLEPFLLHHATDTACTFGSCSPLHECSLSLCYSVTSSLCHSGKECWITALHVSRRNVCVGLTNGKILILQSVGGAMLPLTTFSCHQQQVKCLTTLPPDHADGMDHHHGDEHSWQRAMPHPHPAHLLVSCGLGFHSYPSPSPSEQPSIPHPNALPPAKILTWDLAGLQ